MKNINYEDGQRKKQNNKRKSRRNRKLVNQVIKISGVFLGIIIFAFVMGLLVGRTHGEKNINNTAINIGKDKNKNELQIEKVSKYKIDEFAKEYKNKKDYSKYTVCLDAGHGGDDVGGETIDGVYEKYQTIKLCYMIRQYLESVGVNIVMTREGDDTLSLQGRQMIAENSNANLMLSIHRNIYDGVEEINGVEAWVNSSMPAEAVKISESIINSMIENVPVIQSRGVKGGSMDNPNENYAVNRVSMNSLILEVGFMSSAYDNKWFDEKLEDVAKGIAEGIMINY